MTWPVQQVGTFQWRRVQKVADGMPLVVQRHMPIPKVIYTVS